MNAILRAFALLCLAILAVVGCGADHVVVEHAPIAKSTAAITISAPFSVGAPVLGPLPGGTYNPVIARGKNGVSLVVWNDFRGANGPGFGDDAVYATRIAADGTVLDPGGIPIATGRPSDFDDVVVDYDGQNWLVMLYQYSRAPCSLFIAVRVSDAGTVLDPDGIPLNCVDYPPYFGMAFDGTAHVLVWSDRNITTFQFETFMTRISPAGTTLLSKPQRIGVGNVDTPAISCDGVSMCLAVWMNRIGGNKLRGVRISNLGVVLDAADIAISGVGVTYTEIPIVTWAGNQWVVGWSEADGGHVARVSSAGAILDSPSVALGTRLGGLSWDGTSLLHAFVSPTTTVEGKRLDASLAILDASPFVLDATTTTKDNVKTAFNGTRHILVWDDRRAGASQIYGGRTAATPTALEGSSFLVSQAANAQRNVSVAKTSTGWFTAWEDQTAAGGSIKAARLTEAGVLVDATPLSIATGARNPQVASDGTDHLLVFASPADLVAVRVDSNGVASAPFNLATGVNPASPRVIFDGTRFIAAWFEGTTVKFARLSKTAVLDPSPLPIATMASAGLGLASDGSTFVVAGTQAAPSSIYNIVATRASATTGAVLDPTPKVLSSAANYREDTRAVWDGKSFFVVWSDGIGNQQSDIFGARIDANGTVLDATAFPIAIGAEDEQSPFVVPMNDGFANLVMWSQSKVGLGREYDLYGVFVRRDGTPIDTAPFPISAALGHEVRAVAASGGTASALVMYSHDDPSPTIGAERVRGRLISSGTSLGATCTDAAACTTRACADGLCCESACNAPCRTCKIAAGSCTIVTNADDPDSCTGQDTCDATGACKRKNGKSCGGDKDCASGHCTGGLCCATPCDGACLTCATGTCEKRASRSTGEPTCAPFACDGENATCPTKCASNAACPSNARCDLATGACVAGGFCADRSHLDGTGPDLVDCAPYVCEAAACRTSCRSIADCVAPSVCDDQGKCVTPPSPSALGSGCAATPSAPSEVPLAFVVFALASVLRRRRPSTSSTTRVPIA